MRPRSVIVVLLVLLPVTLVCGMWLGGHPSRLPEGLANLVAEGDTDTRVVNQALDEIDRRYYREIPRRELADAAIRGAVESLDDRFSAYFDREQYARFMDARHARFTGIGVAVESERRGLVVTRVYEGSPADEAGLRQADVIVEADGESLRGKPQEVAVNRVRGEAGTTVRLGVQRGDERLERSITRAEVRVPIVEAERRTAAGRRVAHLRLDSFTSGAHGELGREVRRAMEARARGVVLDLRGNGGGLVEEAKLVTSLFVEEGEVVSVRGRGVPERSISVTGEATAPDLPMVVLVDRGSASASELVVLQRAVVVGERTFGKGVFQSIIELPNGGALDITAGQYFTPDGRNFGGRGTQRGDGLRPDVRARDDPDTERDEALDRALEVLGGKIR
jgi:carboxyl-terminal processing protease